MDEAHENFVSVFLPSRQPLCFSSWHQCLSRHKCLFFKVWLSLQHSPGSVHWVNSCYTGDMKVPCCCFSVEALSEFEMPNPLNDEGPPPATHQTPTTSLSSDTAADTPSNSNCAPGTPGGRCGRRRPRGTPRASKVYVASAVRAPVVYVVPIDLVLQMPRGVGRPAGASPLLTLCPAFEPGAPGVCVHGEGCQHVHAATNAALAYSPHMLRGDWSCLDDIPYERYPPGAVVSVMPARGGAPTSVDSGCILRTSLVAFEDDGAGDSAPPATVAHCVHFAAKRFCHRGALCNFAHVVAFASPHSTSTVTDPCNGSLATLPARPAPDFLAGSGAPAAFPPIVSHPPSAAVESDFHQISTVSLPTPGAQKAQDLPVRTTWKSSPSQQQPHPSFVSPQGASERRRPPARPALFAHDPYHPTPAPSPSSDRHK